MSSQALIFGQLVNDLAWKFHSDDPGLKRGTVAQMDAVCHTVADTPKMLEDIAERTWDVNRRRNLLNVSQ
jgi:hypothetical protein